MGKNKSNTSRSFVASLFEHKKFIFVLFFCCCLRHFSFFFLSIHLVLLLFVWKKSWMTKEMIGNVYCTQSEHTRRYIDNIYALG
jgi:hypothetical protein